MSQGFRAIIVCVEYDDFLKITFPRNRHHFKDVLIVTSYRDERTVNFCQENGILCHCTTAFYDHGALFNKGAAIEEAFSLLGRWGWMMVLDADILLPKVIDYSFIPNYLYVPNRRCLFDIRQHGIPEDEWKYYPVRQEFEYAGYCQIFHADDPVLKTRPWYGIDWAHAGGGDSDFQRKWLARYKIRPNFNVLHLGPMDENWCGRITERIDKVPLEDQDRRKEKMLYVRDHYRGLKIDKSTEDN